MFPLPRPRERIPRPIHVGLWALFFASVALYQLPAGRLSLAGGNVPYLVLPAIAATASTLTKFHWRALPRFRLELILLLALCLATALAGFAHPDQVWSDAAKRIGYLGLGIVAAIAIKGDEVLFRTSVAAFVVTAAAMAIYGFYLMLIGYGEAANLLYWGLHYTESSRNGDGYFALISAFLGLYLGFNRGPIGYRLLLWTADAVLWLAVLYSFSRGTWIAAAVGLGLFLLLLRDWRAVVGAAMAVIIAFGILTIPIRGHHPIDEVLRRGASIASTDQRAGATPRLPSPTVSSPATPIAAGSPSPPGPTPSPLAPTASPTVQSPLPVTNTNSYRLGLLWFSLKLIAEHPVGGVGVGGLTKYQFEGHTYGTLENSYLTAAAEYGFLGLLVTLGIVLVPFLRVIRTSPPARSLLVATLVAFACNSLTVGAIWSAWFWILPLLLAAVPINAKLIDDPV